MITVVEEDAGKFPLNPLCRDFNVHGELIENECVSKEEKI